MTVCVCVCVCVYVCVCARALSHFSHVRLFETQCTVAHQAPLSMHLSSQEYQSALPCPPPGHLLDPGVEPRSYICIAGGFFTH